MARRPDNQWPAGPTTSGLPVRERPDYGYGLAQRLAAAGVADVPGGTLYPALLRLEQQGLAEPSWHPSESGPRRKYYAVTEAGHAALDTQVAEWHQFRDGIDRLVTAGAPR